MFTIIVLLSSFRTLHLLSSGLVLASQQLQKGALKPSNTVVDGTYNYILMFRHLYLWMNC